VRAASGMVSVARAGDMRSAERDADAFLKAKKGAGRLVAELRKLKEAKNRNDQGLLRLKEE